MNELIERLQKSLSELQSKISVLDLKDFKIDDSLSLSEQIKHIETLLNKINQINNDLSLEYDNISSILNMELSTLLNNKVSQLRKQKLIEETDTPREAYDNLTAFMKDSIDMLPQDKLNLLLSIEKYLEEQLLPTKEVIKEIPFDVAKIEDSSLTGDEEIVEVEGVVGQEKIIYEINGDVETELSREVILRPVTKVIRVAPKQQ